MRSNSSTYSTKEGYLVDDPRIDSPEVKVIYPEEGTKEEKQMETRPMKVESTTNTETKIGYSDEILDQGMLEEVEIIAKKNEDENSACDCKVGFTEAFKHNWMLISLIAVGLGVAGFFIGRVTKKVG